VPDLHDQGASVRAFSIAVAEAILRDLRTRLKRTRWPDEVPDSGWDYGTDLGYLKELVGYWSETFDWRSQERLLNESHHFRTEIDRLNIHFIHERGNRPSPVPLVLTRRLAELFFRAHQAYSAADRPGGQRGRPSRRIRRRGPVDAGIRILRSPDRKIRLSKSSRHLG